MLAAILSDVHDGAHQRAEAEDVGVANRSMEFTATTGAAGRDLRARAVTEGGGQLLSARSANAADRSWCLWGGGDQAVVCLVTASARAPAGEGMVFAWSVSEERYRSASSAAAHPDAAAVTAWR